MALQTPLSRRIAELRRAGKTKEEIYLLLIKEGKRVDDIISQWERGEDEREQKDVQKKAIRTIVTLGAVLVGAGIFSFIAANWDGIPNGLKIVLIVAFMVAAYAAGWELREQRRSPRIGEAMMLLGVILYGAGIFLIAQMFNIRANWPDGFLLWMGGAIAVGYVTSSLSILAAALIAGFVAVVGYPFRLIDSFTISKFLMTSLLLLFAATGASVWAGIALFRFRGSREGEEKGESGSLSDELHI